MKKLRIACGLVVGCISLGIFTMPAIAAQKAAVPSQQQVQARQAQAAPAANDTQAVISSLQQQIQQVQTTVDTQLKSQNKNTQKSLQQFQQQVQKQLTLLQKQIQLVQATMQAQINKLQKQVHDLALIR